MHEKEESPQKSGPVYPSYGDDFRERLDCMRNASSPLALTIDKLIRQRDRLRDLCGEILATIQTPGNAKFFKLMGEKPCKNFMEIVSHWREQYEKHIPVAERSGKPTVEELEAILNSEVPLNVEVQPDGSIKAVEV